MIGLTYELDESTLSQPITYRFQKASILLNGSATSAERDNEDDDSQSDDDDRDVLQCGSLSQIEQILQHCQSVRSDRDQRQSDHL